MTNVIHGLSVKLQRLPATALDDVIKTFTKIAEAEGGKVGRYQLTVEASNRHITEGSASVTMSGVPSGFWVWREQGIRGHMIRPRRKKALAGALSHPIWGTVHHPGVPGKGAWTKTVHRAEKELQDAVESALAKVA